MLLENKTDWVVDRFVIQDAAGRDRLLVVAKASFDLDRAAGLSLSEEPLPLVIADEYFDGPETSGVKYSSDLAWGLSATDIALIGHAVAPDESTAQMEVGLKVGKLEHRVLVFGERHWQKTLFGARLSKPEYFERIPLRYECAFGGADQTAEKEEFHVADQRNPVGCGVWSRKGTVTLQELKVPQLECPEALMGRPDDLPAPAGFGFVAPHWEPRLSLAGTYDEAWMQERMPLLPDDFDVRHNQSAHPSMRYDGFLNGDEEVVVSGVCAEGGYAFQLPGTRLACVVEFSGASKELMMNLNKLTIDTDEKKVFMTWSAELDVHGRLYEIAEIEVRSTVIEC